jgi:LysM repeat protein
MLEKNLQIGDSGNDVKILQEKLKILGFYNAVITGDFKLATEIGVKAFQKEYNLEETGVVNQEMWNILLGITERSYNLLRDNQTLSLNDSGDDVKNLQKKLKALLYYTGQINSTFDLETENAVKRLQFNNDITTTGIVDNQTWNVINTLYGNLNECVVDEENYISYTVKSGDTLYSIAKKYGTTVDKIKMENNLSSNLLSIGQVLLIPTESQSNTVSYTVKSGDTLYSIAKKYNTTVDKIKRENNLSSNLLSIGKILLIST